MHHNDSRRDWADHRVVRIMNEEFPGSRWERLLGWLREAGVTRGEWFTTGSGADVFEGLGSENMGGAGGFLDDDDRHRDTDLFPADTLGDSGPILQHHADDPPGPLADDWFDPGFNTANGLPMVGGTDIEGNPYGFDFHTPDHDWHDTSFDSGSDYHDSESFGHHDWDE